MSCVGWRTSPGVGEAPLQRAGEGRELLRGTEVLQHPSGLPPVGDGCKGQLEAPETI